MFKLLIYPSQKKKIRLRCYFLLGSPSTPSTLKNNWVDFGGPSYNKPLAHRHHAILQEFHLHCTAEPCLATWKNQPFFPGNVWGKPENPKKENWLLAKNMCFLHSLKFCLWCFFSFTESFVIIVFQSHAEKNRGTTHHAEPNEALLTWNLWICKPLLLGHSWHSTVQKNRWDAVSPKNKDKYI